MARKYMEKRYTKSSLRSTIPSNVRIPEPSEFYSKATPFVQRTQLFANKEASKSVEDLGIAKDENLQLEEVKFEKEEELGSPDSVLEVSNDCKPSSSKTKDAITTQKLQESPKKKLFGFASKGVLNFIRLTESEKNEDTTTTKNSNKSRIFQFNSGTKRTINFNVTSSQRCAPDDIFLPGDHESEVINNSSTMCGMKKFTSSNDGKSRSGSVSQERQSVPGISYAPGWSLKGEHLIKWQENGKTTLQVRLYCLM